MEYRFNMGSLVRVVYPEHMRYGLKGSVQAQGVGNWLVRFYSCRDEWVLDEHLEPLPAADPDFSWLNQLDMYA